MKLLGVVEELLAVKPKSSVKVPPLTVVLPVYVFAPPSVWMMPVPILA